MVFFSVFDQEGFPPNLWISDGSLQRFLRLGRGPGCPTGPPRPLRRRWRSAAGRVAGGLQRRRERRGDPHRRGHEEGEVSQGPRGDDGGLKNSKFSWGYIYICNYI